MSYRYLYCGAWAMKGTVSGVTSFRCAGGITEKAGVWGEELEAQSILAITGNRLVSVCETRGGGKVVSYQIQADGSLEKKCVLEFDSSLLSYVTAAPNGRYVFVSSMGSSTVKMIRLSEDGSLALTDEWMLTGHSVTPRQDRAKTHSVMVSPDGSLLAAANLGADEVELFQIDYERESLRLIQSVTVDFGKLPRHMAFSPSGEHLYLLTELGNRIYVYGVREKKLQELAAYDTLDPDRESAGMAADIVVSPDGRFVYSTNRAQNNIAVWHTLDSGLLDRVGFFDCGGEGPRGLNISPDGKTLFCANNDSGTVTVMPLDPETGKPGQAAEKLEVPFVGCVRSI